MGSCTRQRRTQCRSRCRSRSPDRSQTDRLAGGARRADRQRRSRGCLQCLDLPVDLPALRRDRRRAHRDPARRRPAAGRRPRRHPGRDDRAPRPTRSGPGSPSSARGGAASTATTGSRTSSAARSRARTASTPSGRTSRVGDPFRLHPKLALVVAEVDPGHSLVVDGRARPGEPAPPYDFTWAFVVRRHPGLRTRLIVRERYGYTTPASRLVVEPLAAGSALMTRKMLHGIRDRVEAARAGRAPAGRAGSPVEQHPVLLVAERADENDDEVDEGPDAEAAEGDQLQDAGADLADIEAVHAEHADEEAEQCGGKA